MCRLFAKGVLAALALITAVSAYNYNFYFSDVKNWGISSGYAKSVDLQMVIDGGVARGAMTIVFKDTLSYSTASDSIELYCQLPMPTGVVIDSLQLWVDGEAVNGLILRKWHAWQIYSNAVGRRRDPALLTQSSFGGNCELRVFPFAHGGERKVRIAFAMPATPVGNEFVFQLPLGFAAFSELGVGAFTSQITVLHAIPNQVAVHGIGALSVSTSSAGAQTNLALRGSACKVLESPVISVSNDAYAKDGIHVQISKRGDADPAFIALLNPGKLADVQQKIKRNIILVWNMVTTYDNYSSYYYNSATGSYVYDYARTSSYAYSSSIDEEQSAIMSFLRGSITPNDQINVYMNDGTIHEFGASLVSATAENIDKIGTFTQGVSRTDRAAGCQSLFDLVQQVVAASAALDSPEVVIVDRTYGYDYRWGSDFTGAVDSVMNVLLSELKPKARVSAVFYPYSHSIATEVVNRLAAKTNGQVLSCYSYNYYWYSNSITGALSELGASLAPRFYPAAVRVSAPRTPGYAYEVFDPQNGRYTVSQPVFIVGRLHGTTSVKIGFSGSLGSQDYTISDQTFSMQSSPSRVNLDILWAYRKAAALASTQQYATPDFQAATDFSLEYHILTPYSALLAPEPGMVIELDADEEAANGGGTPTLRPAPMHASHGTLSLSIGKAIGNPTIIIRGVEQVSGSTLQVFDLQGKMVIDLTKELRIGDLKIELKSKRLGKGTYLVRLKTGSSYLTTKLHV